MPLGVVRIVRTVLKVKLSDMPFRTAHFFFFKEDYMEGNTQFFVSNGKQLTNFSSKLLDPSVPQKTAFQKTAINSTRI